MAIDDIVPVPVNLLLLASHLLPFILPVAVVLETHVRWRVYVFDNEEVGFTARGCVPDADLVDIPLSKEKLLVPPYNVAVAAAPPPPWRLPSTSVHFIQGRLAFSTLISTLPM